MRTLPAALETALQEETTTLARLVKITRLDGTIIRMTDADTDVTSGTETFAADIGFTTSALLIGIGLNQVQGMTLDVALDTSVFTKNDMRARRFQGAVVEVFWVDFTNPDNTKVLMFRGKVGRTTANDDGYARLESLPLSKDSGRFADKKYSQTCRASLGDAQCKFPIDSFKVTFAVTEVVSRSSFIVDTFGDTAAAFPFDDYFGQGQLKWLTGDNESWEVDIIQSNFDTKTIGLFYPMASEIVVGDTGQIYPGCDRRLSTCAAKFDNVLNFRGEPFAPQWGSS